MKFRWDVDDATVVEARIGIFPKSVVTVNGAEIPSRLRVGKKADLPFELPGGRSAAISIRPRFGGAPDIDLRVGDQLMVPTDKKPVTCAACAATVKPNDRFCQSCGKAMPAAEHHVHRKRVNEATGMIWALAVLFAFAGVVLYFTGQSTAETALAQLKDMNPEDLFPTPIDGVTYTVADLRKQIVWESWSGLIVNLLLAAVMVGLALWGRRAPLAAVIVAAATYAVVTVASAIVDPTTISQGVVVKIIVVLGLARGIKGALALRTAHG